MAALTTSHFRDRRVAYRFEVLATEGDSVVASAPVVMTESLTGAAAAGVLRLTFSFGEPASVVDTLLVDRRTLRPLSEVLRVPGALRRIEYSPGAVRAELVRPDSQPTIGVLAISGPYHPFNSREALIRSLPLRTGYHAVLPLYSEIDAEIEVDTVTVLGPSSVDGDAGWSVRFADPAIVQIYQVTAETREIRSSEVVNRANGRRMRYRLTPGGS
jgi:hypothetical protein